MGFKIEQGRREINGAGGLALVGGVLGGLSSFGKLGGMVFGKTKQGWISHQSILKSVLGLFCQGRADYADIEMFRDDPLFKDALGLVSVPSQVTLRQRLDEMAGKADGVVSAANLELLRSVKDFGAVKTKHGKYIPLDGDVSVLDNSKSHKEEVGFTYKGCDGFSPMFAYLGNHGYMLDCEMRPGVQHCQNHTPEFLDRALSAAGTLVDPKDVLLRLDSGNDAADNIAVAVKHGCFYLIKRNLRGEPLERWLDLAKSVGDRAVLPGGVTVYTGSASHLKPGGRDDLGPVETIFQVVVRTVGKDGADLLVPEIEVETWFTNLPESPEEVVELYHSHGTSEQYHSELKTDMDMERPPSGKFATNSLLLCLAKLAFNVLRLIGQTSLEFKALAPVKVKVARRRLATVIRDLVQIACEYITHGNQCRLVFGRNCPWLKVFRCIYATTC